MSRPLEGDREDLGLSPTYASCLLCEPGPRFPHLYNEADKDETACVVLSMGSGPHKGLKKCSRCGF